MKTAELRWQEEEGSYRDDITCIVAFLPFLEDRADESYDNTSSAVVSDEFVHLQANTEGSSPLAEADKKEDAAKPNEFVKRRLSVAQQLFDADAGEVVA